ncbi:MAG: T9SS type A sorting domain-containing protein [Sphingobacteriales bacterium]|jgi:hypothetical protein|nr:T9SS type A sorting domain-containing protein [Sphingobacteriales bacterium]
MKNLYTLLLALLMGSAVQAQDTLLYENFDVDNSLNWATINNGNDTIFVNLDADGLNDASGNGFPSNWFWSQGAFAGNDSTGCIISNSWVTPVDTTFNYFISPPIAITGSNGQVSWTSAPSQTPLYLDGYLVKVSTTDNLETSFTDTLFQAAEYESGSSSNGFNFAAYTFSPGFVHGADSLYVDLAGAATASDSARANGLLRPFSASLAQYAGQTIYIAWIHKSFDDFLVAIDDILVTGQAATGLQENQLLSGAVIYPNPTSDLCKLRFNGSEAGVATLRIFSTEGKQQLFSAVRLNGFAQEFDLPVSSLSAGHYILVAESAGKSTRLPLVVVR